MSLVFKWKNLPLAAQEYTFFFICIASFNECTVSAAEWKSVNTPFHTAADIILRFRLDFFLKLPCQPLLVLALHSEDVNTQQR